MHGEHPQETVVRETAAESGLSVAVTGLRDVLADMRALPHRGLTIHTDRVLYAARVRGGTLRERTGQPAAHSAHRVREIGRRLPLVGEQVGDHFGVGVRSKLESCVLQTAA